MYFQGTFTIHEKGSDLVEFVRENLREELKWIPFKLKSAGGLESAGGGLVISGEDSFNLSKTLSAMKLVPASTLTFIIADGLRAQVHPTHLLTL